MRRRLLLVDDDADVLDALEAIFVADYDLAFAEDGAEAIRRLDAQSFDCVVLDLMMPRVAGAAVMAEIKFRGLDLPVILASASLDVGEQAIKLGAQDYVVKPFDVELLEAKVARIVERRPA